MQGTPSHVNRADWNLGEPVRARNRNALHVTRKMHGTKVCHSALNFKGTHKGEMVQRLVSPNLGAFVDEGRSSGLQQVQRGRLCCIWPSWWEVDQS